MVKEIALELRNISKSFGNVLANRNVNLTVYKKEILSLLGENGSGKTTLMNMISGIYFPDEGEIFVNGEQVAIASPKDAFKYKIGMIHQHFKLVDTFTAAQNVILGITNEKYNIRLANSRVREIAEKYGFTPDEDSVKALEQLADIRGCLKSGGEKDLDRAAFLLLDDFRNSRLGRISLETL